MVQTSAAANKLQLVYPLHEKGEMVEGILWIEELKGNVIHKGRMLLFGNCHEVFLYESHPSSVEQ